MVKYRVELLHEVLEEMKPLIEDHQDEVDLFRGKVLLNPAYEKYEAMSRSGLLHLVTARDDGELVGYFLSLIYPHLHYSDCVYAVNDILYVSPKCRRSSVAYDMISMAEEEYRMLGVSVMTVSMKYNVKFESLCDALGMEMKEYLYMKYIGD